MRVPQVSVVIPTHDRSAMLRLTLGSALWQREVELEVIVVDDGSTDDTAPAVARLADRRVRLVRHETPEGVSAARNRGIDEARGDWVAFLDDDDLWAPHKLASQLQAAGSAKTWVYAGAVKIDERQRIIGGQPPPAPEMLMRRLPTWNLVPGGCSGVIARREALAATGGFDNRLVNLADWDLWIRLGRTGPPGYVPQPLVGYRFHGGQASLDVRLILREAALLDRRYGPPIDRGALHHYLAHRCLVAGRPRQVVQHLASAVLHGELKPVAFDLSGLLLRRLGWRLPPRARPDPHAEWRAQAEGWLGMLEEQIVAPVSTRQKT
jgi:glycosyltransferase involved in cell wall biosynthesis